MEGSGERNEWSGMKVEGEEMKERWEDLCVFGGESLVVLREV